MPNVNIGNTHVPDKVYAYSLQVRHMMFELLECKEGDAVSVEVFDDIGIEKEDGSKDAIQAKSVLSNRNPVSNRAVDLWKTFYNWLIAVQDGELSILNTNFRLFINVDKHGSIVDSFNSSITDQDACLAWETAKNEFYEADGTEKKCSDEYVDYIRFFFSDKNKITACNIIKKFKLETISNTHIESLYERFKEKAFISRESLDKVFIYMLGWIDKQTAALVEEKKPMVICGKNFRYELTAIYREINQKLSLVEIALKPTEDMINSELEAFKTYVEQLDIINCDYTDIVEAISDYLRASANRTIWAEKGDVSKDAMSMFSEELKRIWKNKKRIMDITQKNIEEYDLDQLLYFECKENHVDMGVFATPSFFISGCFHELADDESIGWHPKYKEILEDRRRKDGESL